MAELRDLYDNNELTNVINRIIEDMDHAIALSKMQGASGLRFVTLDGEIINTSGAITGGKYKNATANLLERKQEIFRLEDQLKSIRKEMSEDNERLEELNEILFLQESNNIF